MTGSVQPLVSVVIPTRDRAALVVHAIDSVLKQTLTNFEVIVVDDGSTDDTVEVVRSIGDPRVELLSQRPAGVSAARNAGAAVARASLLTFLDSDDTATPIWLEELKSAFDDPTTDIALCGEYFIEPDGSQTIQLPPDATRPLADEVAARFLAGRWMIRRDLFGNCGGFDTAISYGENTEIALRLYTREPGLHIRSIPRPLLRRTRRSGPPDRAAQLSGAQAVLDRYGADRALFPGTLAAYHTLVGVDCMRHGHRRQAIAHLAAALSAERVPGRFGRLIAAVVPGLARRVWGGAGADPHVMFVVLAPGVGGSVRSLASVLDRIEGATRVVARRPGTSTAKLLSDRRLADGTIDLPVPTGHRLVDRLRATVSLSKAAWQHRETIVAIHANGLAELSIALLPALVGGCRVVAWVHEWQVPRSARVLAPFLRLLGPMVRYAAVSQSNYEMLLASGIAKPSQVSIVVNPIDPADVRANGGPNLEGPLQLAYLGTPAPYKGFHLLPELVRATGERGISWTIFSGPESMMPEFFAELRKLGARVHGKVLDVREAYAGCNTVVVPSLHESFGRVAAEAMANGIPVVASNLPSLRAILGDDEAGLLAPPGDTAAVVDAILRLSGDVGLRKRLGREGLRRSERYAPEPVARSLCHLYGLEPR